MTDVRLSNVTKRYGDATAVDGVDLQVGDGELLVLVGPSGCGKTTLLRTIAGLETPDEGEVYFDGQRATDVPARKRDVGLVFQDYALFPNMDVRGNLGFNLRMRGGADAEEVDEAVRETADLLDVEELLDRRVDALSGGQKQRVALGRAIAGEPTAFLLDEPFANLDASLRDRLRTEIARLQDDLGVTTVHVTHDQHEAMTMGDRIAVMADGRIQQVGTPEAIYAEPANLFVARFVGSPTMALLDARLDRAAGTIHVGDGPEGHPLPAPTGPADDAFPTDLVVGIRPEHVGIGTPSDERLAATVGHVEFAGADAYVYLDAGSAGEVVARVEGDAGYEVDETVGLEFDPKRLHLFDAESGGRVVIGAE